MYVEMKVVGFAVDAIAQMPVIILKDSEEKHAVPVWLNASESVPFAAEFVGRDAPSRTGRKDVFSTLVELLGMNISGIVIDDVKEGVFTAFVRLAAADGKEMKVELHVSEAMLLSLKYRQPVLVNTSILSEVSRLDMGAEGFATENNARRVVDYLDQLDPSDMGKYPM